MSKPMATERTPRTAHYRSLTVDLWWLALEVNYFILLSFSLCLFV